MAKLYRVLVALLVAAAASSALAQVAVNDRDASAASARVEPATAGEGIHAAIDPATGQLRAPTAEEAAALSRSEGPRRRNLGALTVTESPDGVLMVELDESYLDYLLVKTDASGHLRSFCVHGKAAARSLLGRRLQAPPQKWEEK
jgi:hypothetical protein